VHSDRRRDPEPNDLVVRFWNDAQLRHNYNTDDMEHRVPELVEFASTIMTLNTGDLIAAAPITRGSAHCRMARPWKSRSSASGGCRSMSPTR